MNYFKAFTLAIIAMAVTSTHLKAHGDDEPDVEIHLFENGEPYLNCSFVIHESLTQSEFRRFTKQGGGIINFQPLTGAKPLGKFKFNVGLAMSSTPIDQTDGAWNNTFAHPIHEEGSRPHYLGDKVNIPHLRVAMGVSENIDIGVYATKDFAANYGFWGAEVKYGKELPIMNNVYVAGRISHASMFGPKDLDLSNTGIDAIISKKWKIFEPYCGVSGNLNRAKETTDEVELENVNILSPRAFVGSKIEYKFLSTAIEYNVHGLQSLNFKIGARF